MALFENFPYTDLHGMNTDWLVQVAKQFLEKYSNWEQNFDEQMSDINALADQIQAQLNEWYNTHSADIADQLADSLTALNNRLNSNIIAFNTAAQNKAEEIIDSLPADYTELTDTLNDGIIGVHKVYPQYIKNVSGTMAHVAKVMHGKRIESNPPTQGIFTDPSENVICFETGLGWVYSLNNVTLLKSDDSIVEFGTGVRNLHGIFSTQYLAVNQSELVYLDFDFTTDGMPADAKRDLKDVHITNFSYYSGSAENTDITGYNGPYKAFTPFRMTGTLEFSGMFAVTVRDVTGGNRRVYTTSPITVNDEIVTMFTADPDNASFAVNPQDTGSAVVYDRAQTLTDAEKLTARTNIGADYDEDISDLQDDTNSLKSAINNRNIWGLNPEYRKSLYSNLIDAFYVDGCFEQGSININTGEETTSNSRIRSDFIDITDLEQIVVICAPDHRISTAILYDSTKTRVGNASMIDSILPETGLRQVIIPTKTNRSAKYIRVTLMPYPDGTFPFNTLKNVFYYFGSTSIFAEEKNTFTIMSYNVGRYSFGISPYAMTPEQYIQYIYPWRRYIGHSECDVLFLQENSTYLDTNSDHTSRSDLYNPMYPFYTETANSVAIESKLPFVNKGTGTFTSGRAYAYAVVNVGKKQVFMMSIHLKNESASDTPSSADIRTAEMTEILSIIAPYDYAVVAGDTNIANFSELSTLTNGGLVPCNHGVFGNWWTYSLTTTDYSHYDTPSADIKYFDNVFVTNNIRVDDFYADNVYSKLTSDHIPVIAKLTLT